MTGRESLSVIFKEIIHNGKIVRKTVEERMKNNDKDYFGGL